MRAATSDQDAALFLTAALTGLRRGELLALRWRDVDFASTTIRVRHSYAEGHLTDAKVRQGPSSPDGADSPDGAPNQRTRRFGVAYGLDAFRALGGEWDALAAHAGSPFLLHDWLTAWCEAFGKHDLLVATVREPDDALAAAAVLCERRGGLGTPCNEHTGDWDALAVDDAARSVLWQGIAALGHRQLRLAWLRGDSRATSIAGEALASAGCRTLLSPQAASPDLEFPATWQELLAGRSANLRQQWHRRRRALERQGELVLRVTTGGDELERDLDTFLALEASGWKGQGQQGTAVISDPRTLRLYRSFARGTAARGLLRLYLLELDGRALAADLGCALGGNGFLVKTAFDDAEACLAPGLVLRGEVLRASIDEGLLGYDFFGGPTPTRCAGPTRCVPASRC